MGAGTGATVAKLQGMSRAVKGGLGTASMRLPGGAAVGALVAVNAYGGVVDHASGRVVAGPRRDGGPDFQHPVDALLASPAGGAVDAGANTTIGVVATDLPLTVEQAQYVARVSHDGLALTIRPCHTMADGDTMFALASGDGDGPRPALLRPRHGRAGSRGRGGGRRLGPSGGPRRQGAGRRALGGGAGPCLTLRWAS